MADDFGKHGQMRYSDHDQVEDLALFGTSDPLVGKILDGRWSVLKLFGEGSMSTVYQAEHLQSGEYVVLKILNQQISTNASNVKRFDATSREIIGLRHPRIAKFLDIHLDDRGSVFLVLENLPGESLEDVLAKTGHLPTHKTIEIFSQVCEALEYGHEDNVLHRDLKPSNIILLENNRHKDEVKLADYGVAKLLSDDSDDPRASGYITRSKEVFGSPMYMSPEQCMGKRLDPRSDIYSLGCVMYETLTGKPPFVGKNVLETAYKHMNEPPKQLVPDGSSDRVLTRLQTVIFKALNKDPSERYQSISQIKSDLSLMLSGSEEEWNANTYALKKMPKLKGKKQQVKKESSGKPWVSFEVAVIGSVSLIIILVVVVWAFSFLNPEATETSKFNNDEIWLAKPSNKVQESGEFGVQEDTAHGELSRVERETGADSKEYAKALATLISVYVKNGRWTDSITNLKTLVETYKKLGDDQSLSEAYKQLAFSYFNENQLDDAANYATQAVDLMDKIQRPDAYKLIPLQILGDISLQKKDMTKAESIYKRLFEYTIKEKTTDAVNYVMCEFRLSDVYRREGKLDLAEKGFKDGIEVIDSVIRQQSPVLAKAYYCLGLTYAAENKNTEADQYFHKALLLLRQLSDGMSGVWQQRLLESSKKTMRRYSMAY